MKKLLMIVEDDESICQAVSMLLEDDGFAVVARGNGREALDYLAGAGAARPDLILLDLMMPILDGYQFRREMLRDPLLATIPVVVMTAEGAVAKRKSELQVQDILHKPFDVTSILRAVRRNLPSDLD